MERITRIPFYPIPFSLFPVLTLLALNIDQTQIPAAFRAMAFSVGICLFIYIILAILLKSWERAALITAVSWMAVLSYGHVYRALDDLAPLGFDLARHRYLVTLLLGGLAVLFWWAWRKWDQPGRWTKTLNLASLAFVALPIIQISLAQAQALMYERDFQDSRGIRDPEWSEAYLQLDSDATLRDVYYIILDGYGRSDALDEYFEFDNQPFLDELKTLGFYIAECSQSNYSSTALSLTSSLNMRFIDQLGVDLSQADFKTLGPYARQNVVRNIFESLGYEIVSFESEYFVTEWRDADQFLSYFDSAPLKGSGLNAFETIFFNTTLGRIVFDLQLSIPDEVRAWFDYPTNAHRQRILYTLEQLEKMPNRDSPKFVMAHIVAPHEPFVFGPDGEFISARETFTFDEDVTPTNRADYVEGYMDQVQYINTRILNVVRTLIDESDPEPIIIIQADHGTSAVITSQNARMSILNAYYFPEGGDRLLYPSISPVNTFRMVMNGFFDTDYELLEDLARFSNYGSPFSFTVVEEISDACR